MRGQTFATRELTKEEIELWRFVTANIHPRTPQRPIGRADMSAAEPKSTHADPRASYPPSRAPDPARKPLGIIDRRQKRDLQKGHLQIDARLDLHGCTVAEAHHRVAEFLTRAQRDGARVALIVTGKGKRATSLASGYREIGILRRQAPLWLADRRLRHVVAAFAEAEAAHGGSGALYVRLRRR